MDADAAEAVVVAAVAAVKVEARWSLERVLRLYPHSSSKHTCKPNHKHKGRFSLN